MMRPSLLAFSAALCYGFLPLAPAGIAPSSEAVVDLTDSDFDEQVRNGTDSPWFVKFYAPWCGHCKQLAPTWEELAKTLNGRVAVAKVDCTKQRWVADQYDIEGYPTLKLIAESKAYTYRGSRKKEPLEAFALGGWRSADGEILPGDKPFADRAMKAALRYAWTYGLPLGAVLLVGLLFYICWEGAPTPEEIARRRKFEETLAAYEQKMADQKIAEKHAASEKAKDATNAAAVGSPTEEDAQEQKAAGDENQEPHAAGSDAKDLQEKKDD